MPNQIIANGFPKVEVTAEHALFHGYCLTGHYWITFSATLIFNDDGTLHERSTKSIRDILSSEYFLHEISDKEFKSFVGDICTRSLSNVSGLKDLMAFCEQ